MKLGCKIFFFLSSVIFLSGCAFQEYDSKKPDEYWNYWKDENHVKDSPFYPLTTDRDDVGRPTK